MNGLISRIQNPAETTGVSGPAKTLKMLIINQYKVWKQPTGVQHPHMDKMFTLRLINVFAFILSVF